jgi:hypothetical protein
MTTAPKAAPATGKQIVAPLQSLIGGRILALREQRVMLDADLAELYGVQTKVLVQVVKRDLARFPQDFMFQLSADEFTALRSQPVASNTGRGGRRTGTLCVHRARRGDVVVGFNTSQVKDHREPIMPTQYISKNSDENGL